jgi:hypothetical protein
VRFSSHPIDCYCWYLCCIADMVVVTLVSATTEEANACCVDGVALLGTTERVVVEVEGATRVAVAVRGIC